LENNTEIINFELNEQVELIVYISTNDKCIISVNEYNLDIKYNYNTLYLIVNNIIIKDHIDYALTSGLDPPFINKLPRRKQVA
jgi:hypothetical protein